jgi:hypothetical protein
MQFEDAFVALFELGFLGFPGNDHMVELGPGAHSYRHVYYGRDLQDIGTVVVDLLQPQDGVVYDAESQAVMERWNAAQVARAEEQVTAASDLQSVLRWCS